MVEKNKKQKIIKMTWSELEYAIDKLAKNILFEVEQNDLKIGLLAGIPRGGFIIATMLSHKIKKYTGLSPIVWSSKELDHGNINSTIVCDDIADTGKTLSKYINFKLATIHYCKKSKIQPEFWAIEKKEDEWIQYPWENNDEN